MLFPGGDQPIFSELSGRSCTSKLVENWTLKWKHDAQFFIYNAE